MSFLLSMLACFLVVSLFSSCLDNHVCRIQACSVSDISRRHNIRADILALKISSSSPTPRLAPSLLSQWSLSFRCRTCVAFVSAETEHHSSAFWLIIVLCIIYIHVFQKERSLMRVRSTFIYGNEDNYVGCYLGLWWFSKPLVVGSPPRSMTS